MTWDDVKRWSKAGLIFMASLLPQNSASVFAKSPSNQSGANQEYYSDPIYNDPDVKEVSLDEWIASTSKGKKKMDSAVDARQQTNNQNQQDGLRIVRRTNSVCMIGGEVIPGYECQLSNGQTIFYRDRTGEPPDRFGRTLCTVYGPDGQILPAYRYDVGGIPFIRLDRTGDPGRGHGGYSYGVEMIDGQIVPTVEIRRSPSNNRQGNVGRGNSTRGSGGRVQQQTPARRQQTTTPRGNSPRGSANGGMVRPGNGGRGGR